MKTAPRSRTQILALGMVMQLCAGIIYMWSVFRGPVADHLAWDPAGASMTSSVMLAAFVLGIVLGGWAQDRYTPRPVALAGSLLLGLGMAVSAFVPQSAPWLIYLSYGVVGGFGVGCVYTTTVSVVQKWFPDRRGFATGMMVGAFGFSLVLFAPVTRLMLARWGVPVTFLFLGLLFLVVCTLCALFLANPTAAAQSGTGTGASAQKQYTTAEMLRTREFYFLAFSMFFLLPAYFILNPLFISLGVERGLTSELAAVGVMLTGVASASGRLLTSWFSDYTSRKTAILTITIITLCSSLVMMTARGLWFLVCIAAIAFSFGGSSSVYAATAADFFGTKHMGFNYGCVMVGFGASALLFPMVSNALAARGMLQLSFAVAAGTCAITLVLVLLLPIPKK